eukprot:scaffold19266_cov30-Phaeocystis_antarctica.AAC.1
MGVGIDRNSLQPAGDAKALHYLHAAGGTSSTKPPKPTMTSAAVIWPLRMACMASWTVVVASSSKSVPAVDLRHNRSKAASDAEQWRWLRTRQPRGRPRPRRASASLQARCRARRQNSPSPSSARPSGRRLRSHRRVSQTPGRAADSYDSAILRVLK